MDTLLTTEEVALLLRVHPKHVYRLLRRGLPGHRVGAEWRFARDEVLGWVEGGGLNPAAGAPVAPLPGDPPAPRAPAAPLGDTPPLVAANGDVGVELLLARVNTPTPLVGFVPADRDTAMELLRSGAVIAAGCHAKGPPTHLGAARLARIHLVNREVGLAGRVAPDLHTLAAHRLASRPGTAGVRAHLDAALSAANLTLPETTAYATHRDAVLAVLRGDADVALCTHAWAACAGLRFTPLATEAYGLVVRAQDLGDPRVVRICEVAQSPGFRAALGNVPGYDPAGAGDIRYDAD